MKNIKYLTALIVPALWIYAMVSLFTGEWNSYNWVKLVQGLCIGISGTISILLCFALKQEEL